MYTHKRAAANVVLMGALVLVFIFSCSKKQGSKPIEPPKLTLLSNHGAPGKTVQASVTGINISNGSVFIMFDTIPAPIFAIEDQKFSFLVPLLRAGQLKVFVQDTLGATSTTVTFTVDQQPATGQPPGKITADMLSSTIELVDVATSTGAKLRQLGILTPADSSVLSQDISRITTLLSTMQSDFTNLPDSVKTMVDAFLYSAGLSEILNTQKSNSPVGECVSDLEMILATSTPYDTFRVLVALDNFSMVLSDLKAGLTISAVAILIATGGTGSAASGAIAAVCFGISVVDNILDGALPTDLNRLQVSFIPQNGPELNVGEKANVKVVGWFSTQKSPEDATVDVILGGLFYGINVNLAKHLKGVIENLSLKFAQAMSVSLDDVITNVRQVTLPYPVSVDINFYQKDFDQIMEATGMTIFGPGVAVALDLLSFILPDFEVVPLSFSTNAVSYNASSNEVTALTTGILNSSNVSVDAWVCKSLCSGLLSFLCLGAEWPKVIEHDQHTVLAITIAQAVDTTRPSTTTNLEVASVTSNSATLEWTAPGDDGNIGTASQYDVRYSTSNITESNWNSATQCTGEPAPKSAGGSESFVVTGLNSDTKYYFAMKTADEVPNWSGLSNVPSETTLSAPDTTRPAIITNLATSDPTSNSMKLTWTAPGDDRNTGTASQYDIRYSTSNITQSNWGSATQCSAEAPPKPAGSQEFFTVTGLSSNKRYYFGVKTADEVPNWSDLSNVVSDTTRGSGTDVIVPLTVGNYWIYTSSYGPEKLGITGSSTIIYEEHEYLVYFWNWFEDMEHPSDEFWLVNNQDDGLWLIGYAASYFPNLAVKYPAEVGDTWEYFDGDDSLTMTCVSTSSMIATPAGTFECYVYLEKEEDYLYFTPGIGYVGYGSTIDGQDTYGLRLIEYHLEFGSPIALHISTVGDLTTPQVRNRTRPDARSTWLRPYRPRPSN